MSERIRKIVLPILILVVGVVGARAIIAARPEAARQAPPEIVPLVEVTRAERGPHTYRVQAQGSVAPRTASALVAEVAGRIVEIDDDFVEGGFFAEGDVLLRLDDRDSRALVAQSEAEVAQARLNLEREREEARIAAKEWERFNRPDEPTALVLREPQLAQAEAALAAAEARLEKARRDLDRTRIRAPYDGRVRQKLADLGDFLQPGARAAQLYAVDYAEIRVPLPDDDLAFLDLPLGLRDRKSGDGPHALVSGRFAGKDLSWEGYVHRTEGEIDARSRMVHVVVRVPDPYGVAAAGHGVPLSVGMFVNVRIDGRTVPDACVLPRSVLLQDDRIAVTSEGRLQLREVEVLRRTSEEVVIGEGIVEGDDVVLTRLDLMIDGMHVRVTGTERGDR